MKLPKTLWAPFGDVRVRVEREVLRNERREILNGQYRYDERLILIAEELDDHVAEVTLNHEWVHAVLGDAGTDAVLTRKQNEWVAEVLGQAITKRFPAQRRSRRKAHR